MTLHLYRDNESIWKHRKRICFEKKCQKTENLLRNTFLIQTSTLDQKVWDDAVRPSVVGTCLVAPSCRRQVFRPERSYGIMLSVRLSVCPSVRLSVTGIYIYDLYKCESKHSHLYRPYINASAMTYINVSQRTLIYIGPI